MSKSNETREADRERSPIEDVLPYHTGSFGSLTGAAIGSVAGPVGIVVGATVGSVVGVVVGMKANKVLGIGADESSDSEE